MNRQSGVKIFLSVISHLIDFLIRRCHVNPNGRNIHSANLICLAYSRYKHVRATTIGFVNVHILNTQWETGLVLLAKIRSASPIRRDNAYL
jgi:hypothetical protein